MNAESGAARAAMGGLLDMSKRIGAVLAAAAAGSAVGVALAAAAAGALGGSLATDEFGDG